MKDLESGLDKIQAGALGEVVQEKRPRQYNTEGSGKRKMGVCKQMQISHLKDLSS